jgi:hypothetical protein
MTRPWLEGCALRVVRIGSPALAAAIFATLRGTVRRYDDGRSGVAFHEVAATELLGGVAAAVAVTLELPPGLNRLELLGRAAERLADRPTVLLLPPPPEPRPQQGDEAAQWLDRLEKIDPRVRVLIILLDTPEHRVVGEVFDLSVGLPLEPLGAGPNVPDDEVWHGYLHRRLAWEAGGDASRALAGDGEVANLAFADEASFEALLNRSARQAFAELPSSTSTEVQEFVEHRLRQTRSASWLAQRMTSLEGGRLLWRPPDTDTPMPVPWLARGLLLAGLVPLGSHYLRGCLVCGPLAHELLDRCFDIEAQERAGAWARKQGRQPPDVASNRLQSFQEPGSYAAALYPPGCPALPDDPWPFATFGEFLSVMAPGDPRREVWYELLNLRNHLAHGHYVAWPAVQKLREIEETLRGS